MHSCMGSCIVQARLVAQSNAATNPVPPRCPQADREKKKRRTNKKKDVKRLPDTCSLRAAGAAAALLVPARLQLNADYLGTTRVARV